ncbi:transcription regulatory protein Snf11p [Monosporozyma unispora]
MNNNNINNNNNFIGMSNVAMKQENINNNNNDNSNMNNNTPTHPSNIQITPNGIVDPNTLVTLNDQKQYKVQLLLHINSVLLARVIHLSNATNNNNNNNNGLPESIQRLISQSLKRVHANLQCISQINQGILRAKPIILDPPEIPNDNINNSNQHGPPQDILAELYLLMARIFEFW